MEYRAGDTSTVYRYVTDAFGKITGLLDSDGNYSARYVYDGYGSCEIKTAWTDMPDSTIASLNPFRYNGYYYDAETGLYYCNSRYYDAENGRLVNSDEVIAGVGGNPKGYNLYAYCFNDPVNFFDANGNWPTWAAIKRAVQFVFSLFTGGIRHDVPLYEQGQSNLCWAYCQVMVEDYKNRMKRSNFEAFKRACEISMSVHGESNWNSGHWPTNCKEYYSDGEMPVRKSKSLFELYCYLKYRGPIYAHYSNGETGHLVVVTGVDLLHNRIYTNNPWGIKGVQTYGEFLNGFAGGPTDGSYFFICFYEVDYGRDS